MNLVSWAKKELKERFKIQKRLLLPQTTSKTSATPQNQIAEVVIAADIRCSKCQERIATVLSDITITDVQSIVVHLVEKKVTLTRKLI